mmetsp:Transcript_63420/g.136421  ORF Transcript_63420/g.136421 Transcript_63420/m.136421 type:complete len:331 (-) Transcript_63420:99-1091(-)
MRFGKKLALQVTADQTGAPYLSHKLMKEAINKTVRELRMYQSAKQSLDSWQSDRSEVVTAEDIRQLEDRIMVFDMQLFQIVDEDLMRILGHVRNSEARLGQTIADFQADAICLGILLEEAQMDRLKHVLPCIPESRTVLCQQLLDLRLRSDPAGMAEQLDKLTKQYCDVVDQVDEHMQYLEINVAGFRKLLKRHEKQIPQKFHACQPPFLEFHRLVTRTSRQLSEVAQMLGAVLRDTRERLAAVAGASSGNAMPASPAEAVAGSATAEVLRAALLCSQLPPVKEPKGLGPECDMVIKIQQQLRDPSRGQVLNADLGEVTTAPTGFLYPKP